MRLARRSVSAQDPKTAILTVLSLRAPEGREAIQKIALDRRDRYAALR
jgi:hypothetical protein